jgi:hypothetical protein
MSAFILLTGVLDLFKDYGIVITIVVLFILIAYMIINNSTKRIREQQEKIDTLYGRIDDLMNKFTSSDDKSDFVDSLSSYADNTNKIQIQLYHLLQKFNADRISIYEFHNGGKNLAGVEFRKCSNMYEAVSLETKPVIKEMQNLPLSMNPLWNKVLASCESIIIPSVDDLNDDFLKEHLSSQNIKTYYSVLMSDYSKTPIGFMTLENYHNNNPLDDEQLKEFNETAIKISILMNLKS